MSRTTAARFIYSRRSSSAATGGGGDASSDISSSSSDDDEVEDDDDEVEGEEEEEEQVEISKPPLLKVMESKKARTITISLKKVCKVCKRTGHEAGFRGAVYIDCPMKPCFLCKMPGHTTLTCPHRVTMEHGVIPAPKRSTRTCLDYVFQRQLECNVPKVKPSYIIPNQLDRGNIKFHIRRITFLEFHPTKDTVIVSGDKKGLIGIWDYGKPYEKTIYDSIHTCIVNNIKFDLDKDGTLYTASSDGTISYTDLETGISSPLLDLNPDGWNGPNTWRMLYAMDVNTDRGLLLVADNFGFLYLLDKRLRERVDKPILIHRMRSKVTGLHCNPAQSDLVLSCGNDHFARIWDSRRLEANSSLASLPHGRVVNSAYFSPRSGNKILTTCQDNRIRVWDSIFGNLESPSREIVHSHDFNRHLTPFRAEWDPKDPTETVAVIGRYISENYNGVALHPVDFVDISTGKLLAEVMDPDITTISPVNKLHPRDDILATGSSRSIFIWKPKKEETSAADEDNGMEIERFIFGSSRKKGNGNFGYDSEDDSDVGTKGKSRKTKDTNGKYVCSGKAKGKSKA